MSLSIPSRTKPGQESFPTTPEAVRSWLSVLHPLERPETISLLYRGLKHSNRLEIPNHLRLEIAEIFAPAVDIAIDRLQTRYTSQSLPLAASADAAHALSMRLLKELGYSYKIVVNDTYATLLPGQSKARSQGIYQGLSTITRQAESLFSIHRPITSPLLQEANTLYDLARKSRLEHHTPAHPQPESLPEDLALTIENTYIYIQLLALARPGNQRRAQIPIMCRFLAAVSTQIQVLSLDQADPGSPSVYAICVDQDSPPQPLHYLDKPALEEALLIDLSPILALLDEQLENLPETTSLLLEPETMLRPTLQRLRESLQRQHSRRAARAFVSQPADIQFGWLEVNAALSAPAATTETEKGIPVLKNEPQVAAVWPPRNTTQRWTIVNMTDHGVGLNWNGSDVTGVENGQITLLRLQEKNTEPAPIAAIVRWISDSGNGLLRAGCEILGMQPRVLQLHRPDETDPRGGDTIRVTGLYCRSVTNKQEMLIVPTLSVASLPSGVALTDRQGTRWILGNAIEEGQLISVFGFRRMPEEVTN